MKWFGEAFGAPYEEDTPHTLTPVGTPCARCGEAIEVHDSGVTVVHCGGDGAVDERPLHYECHLRGIIGGANHLMRRCTCCGGTEPPDPPELTKRQAARAAVSTWQWRRTLEAFQKREGTT